MLDMRPGLSFYNALNSECAYGVFSSHAVTGLTLGVFFSDCSHVVFCEDGLGAIRPPSVFSVLAKDSIEDAGGVEEVFAASDDLKVFDSVVVFDAVDVIYHQPIRNGADEDLVNKAMDFEGLYPRGPRTQGNDVVTVFVYTALDDLPPSSGNPASVGDLIAFPIRKVRPGFVFHSETIQ